MLSQEASAAYVEWKSSGMLVNDRKIVEEIYDTFKAISDHSARIPQFELMWKNSLTELVRLQDIIDSRYGRK